MIATTTATGLTPVQMAARQARCISTKGRLRAQSIRSGSCARAATRRSLLPSKKRRSADQINEVSRNERCSAEAVMGFLRPLPRRACCQVMGDCTEEPPPLQSIIANSTTYRRFSDLRAQSCDAFLNGGVAHEQLLEPHSASATDPERRQLRGQGWAVTGLESLLGPNHVVSSRQARTPGVRAELPPAREPHHDDAGDDSQHHLRGHHGDEIADAPTALAIAR